MRLDQAPPFTQRPQLATAALTENLLSVGVSRPSPLPVGVPHDERKAELRVGEAAEGQRKPQV